MMRACVGRFEFPNLLLCLSLAVLVEHSLIAQDVPRLEILLNAAESSTLPNKITGTTIHEVVLEPNENAPFGSFEIFVNAVANQQDAGIRIELDRESRNDLHALSLYVDGSQCTNISEAGLMVIDANGKAFVHLVKPHGNAWQKVTAELADFTLAAENESSDSEPKVSLPIQTIFAIARATETGPTRFAFDALTAILDSSATEDSVELTPIGNPHRNYDDSLTLNLVATNKSDKPIDVKLSSSIRIDSYDGDVVQVIVSTSSGSETAQPFEIKQETSVNLAPRSIARIKLKSNNSIAPGNYVVHLSTKHAFGSTTDTFPYLVDGGEVVEQSVRERFGVNISDGRRAKDLRELGFGWARVTDISWADFNPSEGVFDFDSVRVNRSESLTQTLEALDRDTKVVAVVSKTPDWSSVANRFHFKVGRSFPPSKISHFEQAINQFSMRFGGAKVEQDLLLTKDRVSGLAKIDVIQPWNRPDDGGLERSSFIGSLAHYAELLDAGRNAALAADHNLETAVAAVELNDATIEHFPFNESAESKFALHAADHVAIESSLDQLSSQAIFANYLTHLNSVARQNAPWGKTWVTQSPYDFVNDLSRWKNRSVGQKFESNYGAKLVQFAMTSYCAGTDVTFLNASPWEPPPSVTVLSQDESDEHDTIWNAEGELTSAGLMVKTALRQLPPGPTLVRRIAVSDPELRIYAIFGFERHVIVAWTTDSERFVELSNIDNTAITGEEILYPSINAVVAGLGHHSILTESSKVRIRLSPIPVFLHFKSVVNDLRESFQPKPFYDEMAKQLYKNVLEYRFVESTSGFRTETAGDGYGTNYGTNQFVPSSTNVPVGSNHRYTKEYPFGFVVSITENDGNEARTGKPFRIAIPQKAVKAIIRLKCKAITNVDVTLFPNRRQTFEVRPDQPEIVVDRFDGGDMLVEPQGEVAYDYIRFEMPPRESLEVKQMRLGDNFRFVDAIDEQ